MKLAELSQKAAEASEDAKAYRELRKEVIEDKISTAKGNVAAMQENARIAEEERQGKIRSALLKARMTAKAKHEDRKDARDKRDRPPASPCRARRRWSASAPPCRAPSASVRVP